LEEPAPPLPRATADIAPIHGRYRVIPEDFLVFEIPAYFPSGTGSHVFAHIEKRGLTTPKAVELICRAVGADPRAAGFAGMKDKYAVTRQWVSVQDIAPEALLALDLPDVRVLEAHRHDRKLKTGHLRANRFELRIRDVPSERHGDLERGLARLCSGGFPNYFGAQRFGEGRRNVDRAIEFISGEKRPPRAPHERKMLVSALQSFLFNRYVADRVEAGTLDRVELGEIVKKEDTGGLFEVDDVLEVQVRVDRFEVSSTGPMFGPKMRWPSGAPRAREEQLLSSLSLDEPSLDRMGKLAAGTRRVIRVRPEDASLAREDGDVILTMTLPKGTYATTVLDELFKEGLVEHRERP
jgi:tRNA pseudouridine13 synthase